MHRPRPAAQHDAGDRRTSGGTPGIGVVECAGSVCAEGGNGAAPRAGGQGPSQMSCGIGVPGRGLVRVGRCLAGIEAATIVSLQHLRGIEPTSFAVTERLMGRFDAGQTSLGAR